MRVFENTRRRRVARRAAVTAATVAVLAAVACLGAACVGAEKPSRPEVLGAIADEVIRPGYDDARAAFGALSRSVAELCASPDEAGPAGAREALAEARRSWKSLEATWVGPVMDRRSWALIDWPPNDAEIRELIDDLGGPAIDTNYMGSFVGADQRGLGTAEILLGESSGDLGGRACDYLRSVAGVAEQELTAVAALWGEAATREALLQTGVDELVNDAVFLLRRMTDMELGAALGLRDRPADLDAIVEGPSGLGTQDGLARLDGIRAVFFGADGTDGADGTGGRGLASLLESETAEQLAGDLAAARAAWEAVSGPLREAVSAQRDAVVAVREALKQVQRTIAGDVVAQLGVTIGFSDLDGDSG